MSTLYKSIGLIGDVHCEHQSLAVVIDELNRRNVEGIICTGDIPTGPGDINACCDLLLAHQIRTIRGNHDRWLMSLPEMTLPLATHPGVVKKKSWRFLESLPVTIEIPTVSGLALVCHGLGQNDMQSIMPASSDRELDENRYLQDLVGSARYRWIINGHSHHRMVCNYQSLTIINAGTLRRDHDPCFALIDFELSCVTYWDLADLTEFSISAELPI